MPVVKAAGDSALLLELAEGIDAAVNARAISIAAAMQREAIRGVRDVVSTYRSVAVYFDPLAVDEGAVRDALQRALAAKVEAVDGRRIEVPVAYGGEEGPDLPELAAWAELSLEQVIARHSEAEYRVFMLGFLPGFAYMGVVSPGIAMPRRATPRLRVPAGSVGVAGLQTAVYPRDSPGGWQIIGRTPLRMFDATRTPASLLSPGDSVTFVRQRTNVESRFSPTNVESGVSRTNSGTTSSSRTIRVLRPGLFTTVQDCGRWGHQSSGVPVSGAMDCVSHRLANGLVGNSRDAATLEVTLSGPELRIDADAMVAVTGANLGATHDGAPLPLSVPIRVRRGSVLRFGSRRAGTRAYVAFDGGVAVPPVLGSRSTHTLSGLGGLDGRALVAGDCLPLADHQGPPVRRRVDVDRAGIDGGVRVRVLRGPQDDFFPDAAFEALQRNRFRVTPQSDRMGYRLDGARIPRVDGREMISDATFMGAIQVPASGQPILLMADRQTTGGYPQIATVITADLSLAAQLAPGDWIEFQLCSPRAAVAALAEQEGALGAVCR